MKINSGKNLSAVLSLLLIVSSVATAFAQRNPGNAANPTSASQKPLVSETNALMSAAWASGKLPAPLRMPEGDADEVMAVLARKVAAKDGESIPALLRALQLAGFFITDQDGSIFLAPANGKGQGLTLNGWEVAGAAKMYGDGKTVNLSELGEKLKSIPAFKKADVSGFLLEGVRQKASAEDNLSLRAWARFINELGKNSSVKYDIAGGAKAEGVKLDAIQHLLLMRRLYGDLFVLSEKSKTRTSTARAVFRRAESQPSLFVNASFVKAGFAPSAPASHNLMQDASAAPKTIPCRMDGNAPTVMDAAATVAGIGFDQFYGYLGDFFEDTPVGDKIGKATHIIGVANIILAYAKFIQTYAALETKIFLEDAPPLIRTKNAVPGGRKNLRAEVRINIGNWQMYNCIRTAMNVTTGLDFATLNDGPIGDVGVRWILSAGGDKDAYSARTGLTGSGQIVGFAQDGAKRIQDAGTSAGGKNSVGDLTFVKTDENGVARIILEGTPQKNAKIGKVSPVTKYATVATRIKMKAGEIKGDMVDVAGQAIAGIPGLITMPLELLYRVDWASTASLTVPVRDWEECDGGWNGTVEVSYRRSSSRTKITNPGEHPTDQKYSGTLQEKSFYTYDASFNVQDSPSTTDEVGDISVSLKGAMTAEALRLNEETDRWKTETDCFPDSPRIRVAGKNSSTTIIERGSLAEAEGDGNMWIKKDRFRISFGIPEIPATHTNKQTIKPFGWCHMEDNPPHDSTDESSDSFSRELIEIEGTFDPKNPGEIRGSKSYTAEDGTEVVIRWTLNKCS